METDNVWSSLHDGSLSRRRALAAGAGTAALLLGACGRTKSTSTSSSSTAGQASKPQSGGEINLTYGDDPNTFDPSTKLAVGAQYLTETNNSLMSFKAGPDVKFDQLMLQPSLAQRWEIPDPQTYVFHLYPGVKFANLPPVNGRPFTSADVKWTYQYMSRTGPLANLPPATAASMFFGLDRIDTPDDATISVHFSAPFAPFLNYAASQWLPILAHEIFDADHDFSKQIVGTGPFQLDMKNSQKGARWVFKKNPDYFVRGQPYLDGINHLITKDQATINAAFLSKQVDILNYQGLNLDTVQQVQKSEPSMVVDEYIDVSNPYDMYMNVSKPPLDDQRIRQAISLSIDRDEFIKTLAHGKGEWALAGGQSGLFTADEMRKMLKLDPAQAKQLVQSAGYDNGIDVEFIYNGSYGDAFVTKIQLLQSQLKKGGINLSLKALYGGQEALRRRSGDFQLGMTPRGQGIPQEIDSYVYGMYYPGSGDNQGRVNDPQLTPLLVAQRQATDPAKRRDILRQAVQRINTVPWGLALYYEPGYQVWHSYVKNYAPNTAYPYGDVVWATWLAK